jgi:hypothetical protein
MLGNKVNKRCVRVILKKAQSLTEGHKREVIYSLKRKEVKCSKDSINVSVKINPYFLYN